MKKQKFPPCFPTVEDRIPGFGDIVAFIVLVTFTSSCLIGLYVKTDKSRQREAVKSALAVFDDREKFKREIVKNEREIFELKETLRSFSDYWWSDNCSLEHNNPFEKNGQPNDE